MADPRVQTLARTLVSYSAQVQPGHQVALYGPPAAAPLLLACASRVLAAGGHPHPLVGLPGYDRVFLGEASDAQLAQVSSLERLVREEFDCMIMIRGESNTRALSSIDPQRQRLRASATRPLTETFMRRSAAGELAWVVTLFPTEAHAQEADLSLAEFEDFVYAATYSDREDPVAEWQALSRRQAVLVDWLRGKSQIDVKGPNVDLTLSIVGRTFINSDGRHNMPSGEIFTGPVEDSVEGWVRFTYPAIVHGREVEGVFLRFEAGRVIEASATKNEAFLLSQLDTDEGARRLGEWAIGTNDRISRFTKNILFDEKIGGTIHMAVGAGYPQTGSLNKSAIHWDMICDMRDGGRISVDGELFYESGRFLP